MQILRDYSPAELHSARSEQTQAFTQPATQPNFYQLHCKYLELKFTDFVSPGRRFPIDPAFNGFLTNNPWNLSLYHLNICTTKRNISVKSFNIFKRN